MIPDLEYPFDGNIIMRRRKSLRRKLLSQSGLIEKKIAVLGGSTTHDIREILELFLLNYGIRPIFFESEYAQYWQDAMFGNKELELLEPDIIYIHTTNRNILTYPELTDSLDEIDGLLEQQYLHFERMWKSLEVKYHCPIIQNNFEYPYYRLLGNQDAANPYGKTNFVTRLNQRFYEYAQKKEHFYINDINYQSADYGLKEWSDPFFWHMYKYALCQRAIPMLCFNIANIIKSVFGKNKKALALDLDNTLWGGVVGDDGAEHLELGHETALGQAYMEFQSYLKELYHRGYLLTILSKNEEQNALSGLSHPQMVIKKENFIKIMSNWEPKSENLLQIANELALLPESFVFVDDSPSERELVKCQLPEVAVPVMDKPEHYIYSIDRAGYFEATHFSKDDLKRNDMYKQNESRIEAQKTFTDYKKYLLSLEMQAEIKKFEPFYLARIAQLTNKSNQFNLTTRRFSEAEIKDYAERKENVCLFGKLSDKFGDNGVVTVVMGRQEKERFHIELWLMSCRVLKRGMEAAMMDVLVEEVKRREIKIIIGYYYKTAKNAMVSDFYGNFGFEKASQDKDGNSKWILKVDRYKKTNDTIEVMDQKRKEE